MFLKLERSMVLCGKYFQDENKKLFCSQRLRVSAVIKNPITFLNTPLVSNYSINKLLVLIWYLKTGFFNNR